MAKIQNRNHKHFDAKAKLRILKPNDKVWVLNTNIQSKFDFNWLGPAVVLGRKGKVTYLIKFDSGAVRLYHINMLKPYVSRDEVLSKTRTKNNDSILANTENVNQNIEVNCETVNTVASIQGLVEVSDNQISEDEDSDGNQVKICDYKKIAEIPVPSTVQKEIWKDVCINPDLDKDQNQQF